jgi:hypothetical protein
VGVSVSGAIESGTGCGVGSGGALGSRSAANRGQSSRIAS